MKNKKALKELSEGIKNKLRDYVSEIEQFDDIEFQQFIDEVTGTSYLSGAQMALTCIDLRTFKEANGVTDEEVFETLDEIGESLEYKREW